MSSTTGMLVILGLVVAPLLQGAPTDPLYLWPDDQGPMHPPLKVAGESTANPTIKWGWFDQKLDHFNGSDTRRWQQRYVMNPIYGTAGGPGFLMFGGESPTTEEWLKTADPNMRMEWMKNAQRFGATCFILEHRYFGESIPIQGAGNDPSKMVYLSSRQALADTADFLKWAEKRFNLNKWIVFGGSYSGTLSAAMRLKYPDVVLGAVSSSGGTLAVADYNEYYQIAGNDLRLFDQRCYDETKKMFDYFEELVKGDLTSRQLLERKLNLCHDVQPDNKEYLSSLFEKFTEPFFNAAQYGGDNRPPYDTVTIESLCKIMMDTKRYPDLIKRWLAVRNHVQKPDTSYGGNWQCLDTSDMEDRKSNLELASGRGWNWLCCAEFGWLQSSDNPDHPFGRHSPLELRYKLCKDSFNLTPEEVRKRVDETNAYYGGNRGYNATNVVIVNGSQDPFYKLGMWNEEWQQPGQKVIFMEGQAHCADMYRARDIDTQLVKDTRKVITQEIGRWLNESP